jgi:hypothetical protein
VENLLNGRKFCPFSERRMVNFFFLHIPFYFAFLWFLIQKIMYTFTLLMCLMLSFHWFFFSCTTFFSYKTSAAFEYGFSFKSHLIRLFYFRMLLQIHKSPKLFNIIFFVILFSDSISLILNFQPTIWYFFCLFFFFVFFGLEFSIQW